MKKLCIITMVTVLLGSMVLIGCKETERYEGKYYNVEFVTGISFNEYQAIFPYKFDYAVYRKSWSSKSGYEKKTHLTDTELSDYIISKCEYVKSSNLDQIFDYCNNTNFGYTLNTVVENGICDLFYIYTTDKTGTYKEFSFCNPTDKDISIFDDHNNLTITVPANTTKAAKLLLNFRYYYMDDSDVAGISPDETTSSINYMLGVERPIAGKRYICLNRNKNNQIEASENCYCVRLYEVVEPENKNAYKYSEDTYICSYPSFSCWFHNPDFINTNLLGKEISFNDDLFSQFNIEEQWIISGWPTQKDGKLYMHFFTNRRYIQK